MHEAGVGDKLIIGIGLPESGDVFRIHATVLQMERGADRFALDDGEALLDTASDNPLEMIVGQFLRIHAPMGVAQVEKRRSIGMHQVFRSFPGFDEAMLVDSQVARVSPATEAPFPAIQRRIVRADALPGPTTGLRRGEANDEPVSAVPEGRNRQRPARGPVREPDVHPDAVPATGVITPGSRETQLAHPPGFGLLATRDGQQRHNQRKNLSAARSDPVHCTQMVTGPSRPEV